MLARALGAGLDFVAVPLQRRWLGGSGIALGLSDVSPQTRVVSVEPEFFDGMRRSLQAGERTAAPAIGVSIADSLMAPMPGRIAFAILKGRKLDGLDVTDAELVRAVSFAFQCLKLVVEPSGSAAPVALLAGKIDAKGRNVAIVLSGGNCDPQTVARCCDEVPAP